MKKEHIYRVVFKQPPLENDDRREFFFTSLSAIYDTFTPELVGCKVERLWTLRISDGKPYNGRLCEIKREEVRRKAQKRPVNGAKNSK